MGPIGMQEMMVIFIFALLLFGPKKLPELARMLGKGLSEFRRAKSELQSTFNTHMQELEREARVEESKKSAATSTPVIPPPNPYSYAADEFGQTSAGYGYSSSDSSYPAEAAVESHWNDASKPGEIAATSEAAVTPQPVAGSVPRSNGVHPVMVPGDAADTHSVNHAHTQDEHPA